MQAAYLITYRADPTIGGNDGGYRRRNLETVLAWLQTIAPPLQLDVLVVEQSMVPTLTPDMLSGARALHVYNPGPFNKSWGLNIAARQVTAPWLFFGDADMMLPEGLQASAELLAQSIEVVKPYDRLIDLTQAQTLALDDGEMPIAQLQSRGKADRTHLGEHIVLAGGVFAMQASSFARMGGFDERFLGWGGEDDAMTLKIQRLRPSVVVQEASALHLYHDRDPATLTAHPNYVSNVALLEHYRQLPDAPLLRLFEIQKQMVGNVHKYSPARFMLEST
jgi:hypothetical protein